MASLASPGPAPAAARLVRPSAMALAMAGVVAATIAAIVLAALLWTPEARERGGVRRALSARTVVPPTIIPTVEPIEFADVAPSEAREINAAVPFAPGPNPAARPFVLTQPAVERARAQDCLAAAMLYEAGSGDPDGQRAVAQVVINRLRHPAFPKTICGVVFQGQERRTGCQFTFTCDGAITRRPGQAAWDDARTRAGAMLDGAVFAQVGHSTHYHTDWVVPYWSSSLDKVTAVRTHLFFRWTGWWGTPGAFRGRHAGAEPAIAKLAALGLAPAHMPAEGETPLDASALDVASAGLSPVLDDGAGTIALLLDPGLPAGDYTAIATTACGERPYCKVFGWTDRAHLPAALPISEEAYRLLAFSYLRDRARGFDKALWNCDRAPRPDQRDCMKQRVFLPSASTDSFRLESLGRRSPAPAPRPAAEPASRPAAPAGVEEPAAAAAPIVAPAVRRTIAEGR